MAVVGFKYYFGIHMGISRGPVDELIEIKVGDKTAWRGSITGNGNTNINAPELFGGDHGEGGVVGVLTSLFGGPTQTAPGELAAVLKTPMPGFRRRFTLFFNGLISSLNPYPKAWKVRFRRAREGWDGVCWYPEKAIISLTRIATTAETKDSSETKTVIHTFSGVPTTADPDNGPWTIDIVPEGDVGAPWTFVNIYIKVDDGNGYGNLTSLQLQPGTDYSISGDTFTLVKRPVNPNYEPWGYNDTTIFIDYSIAVTTVTPNPNAPGDVLIQAMNPAHMIYEALTNREWGRGLDRSRIDEDRFVYAANKLFEEKLGLCLRWNRTDEIESFIKMVLDHIGGVVYDDRVTGKVGLCLVRDDYVAEELTLFTVDTGLLEVRNPTVPTLAGMINEVQVTYRDPVTNMDRTVRASNLAAVRAAGGAINMSKKSYPGIPTGDLAEMTARRDIRATSPAIRKYEIVLDRRAWRMTPGSVFRIQDMARGIPDTVVRAGPIDYGQLGDGKIIISSAQDVFAKPNRAYATIGPPQWEPPSNRPCLGVARVFEMPYRSLYRSFNSADFAYLNPASAGLGAVVQEGQPLNTTYKIAVRPGAPDPSDDPIDNSFSCGV